MHWENPMFKNTSSSFYSQGIRMILTVLTIVSLTSMSSAQIGPEHDKVVFCSVYPNGRARFDLETFDGDLCTHFMFSYLSVDMNKFHFKESEKDIPNEMKRKFPHLRVGVAIGGDAVNTNEFPELTSDRSKRQKFIVQITNFLREFNFDCVVITWLHPNQDGLHPKERENFVSILKEFREEFDKHDISLVAELSAQKKVIDNSYDLPEISKYVDYLLVRAYDYHGSWEGKVGFNSPLRSYDDDLNIEFSIDYLVKMGAPKSKLVLGIPFFGRSFNALFDSRTPFRISSSNAENVRIGSEAKKEESSVSIPYVKQGGYVTYSDICMTVTEGNNWSITYDSQAEEVLAVENTKSSNTEAITFDSPRSIANKARYAVKKSLAGFMTWSVEADDFAGDCKLDENTFVDFKFSDLVTSNSTSGTQRLLRTLNEATVYALQEIDMEEKDSKEKERKEQQLREQQLKEQQLKEQQLKEQQMKEQQLKDQLLKEQQLKEQELKDQLLKEQELKDQLLKEQLLKEQEFMKQLMQLQLQLKEEQQKKKEFEDQLLKQKEQPMKQETQEELKPKNERPPYRICYFTIPKRCFNKDFTGVETVFNR